MSKFFYEIQNPDFSCENIEECEDKVTFINFASSHLNESFEKYLEIGEKRINCCPPNLILHMVPEKNILAISKMRNESNGFTASYSGLGWAYADMSLDLSIMIWMVAAIILQILTEKGLKYNTPAERIDG